MLPFLIIAPGFLCIAEANKPIAPLPRARAQAFAEDLVKTTRLISNQHLLRPKQSDLIRAGLQHLSERARRPIPVGLRRELLGLEGFSEAERIAVVRRAREHLGDVRALRNAADLKIAIEQPLRALGDHRSNYVAEPERCRLFNPGGYSGSIGVELEIEPKTRLARIVTPVLGSPACAAGLRSGDVITHFRRRRTCDENGDGDQPEWRSVVGASAEQLSWLLRGNSEVHVELRYRRKGEAKAREVRLTPRDLEDETILGCERKDDDHWNYWLDKNNRIAYARIEHFALGTADQLKKVMIELRRRKMRALVLDLRGQPGLLFEMRAIAELLGGAGILCSIVRSKEEYEIKVTDKATFPEVPLVVLVNERTRSAGEVLAAFLQDKKRATVIGSRSAGDCGILNYLGARNGEVWLATAAFLRSSGGKLDKLPIPGRSKDEWGVSPNKGFHVPTSAQERQWLTRHHRELKIIRRDYSKIRDAAKHFRDRPLEKALQYLRSRV